MPFNIIQLGRTLFWYSILFSIYVVILTIIFIGCGFSPAVLKFLPHVPFLDSFFSEVQKYIMSGQPLPASVRALVFLAVIANVAANFFFSFALLITHLLVILQAPLPIVFAGGVIGLALDVIKWLYVASVVIGQAPFG